MNTIVTKTEVKLNSKPERTGNAKPVFCITDFKPYASGFDAAKANGVNQTAISAACTGKIKTVKGKKYCFIKDIPVRILDIAEAGQALLKDANAYRAEKAYEKKKSDLYKEIEARKQRLEKEQQELSKAEAMYAAIQAEFNV